MATARKSQSDRKSTEHPTPTHAITVLQPWAWALATGFKTLENRRWKSSFRGRVAIHAGANMRLLGDEYGDRMDDGLYSVHPRIFKALDDRRIGPNRPILNSGAIIGTADVVACIAFNPAKDDPDKVFAEFANTSVAPEIPHGCWAEGPYCFVLQNARRFRVPIYCPGALNFWKLPDGLRRLVGQSDHDILADPGEPATKAVTYQAKPKS